MMQNQILNYKIVDNTTDNYFLINPVKQQVYSLPREESQMLGNKSSTHNGSRPAGYSNDPATTAENRAGQISFTEDPHLLSSYTPTDYVGMSNKHVPTMISEDFTEVKIYNPADETNVDLYANSVDNIKNISNGAQLIKFPADFLNDTLTDPTEITANGGPIRYNYGNYYIKIAPKYIEANVILIEEKQHFEFSKLEDNETFDGLYTVPEHLRRNIYTCNLDNFIGAPWNFDAAPFQSGRLMDSVIEIWNSSGTILKQTKIISEDFENYDNTTIRLVLYPDNFGYEPDSQSISVGDVVRIYPRETYFDQILINLSYEDQTKQVESMLQYMLNDVVRNMKTGIYEIYDNNGFKIDNSGNFSGNVIQKYQIEQHSEYETRKKIK